MENVLEHTPGKETWLELDRASVETTKGRQVWRESDGKWVGRGWKVSRESDVRLRRVGAVGLGHTWHDKSSRAGGTDGAVVQGHGTSLPGTAWTWHCDIRGHMGIIVKFSEALPCVKSPVSRTSGTIYVVT